MSLHYIRTSGVISASLETWDDGTVNVKKIYTEILCIYLFCFFCKRSFPVLNSKFVIEFCWKSHFPFLYVDSHLLQCSCFSSPLTIKLVSIALCSGIPSRAPISGQTLSVKSSKGLTRRVELNPNLRYEARADILGWLEEFSIKHR